MFLHFETDQRTYTIQNPYLYSSDLLVAPVHQAGAEEWTTYLPSGAEWVHLWSGTVPRGGKMVRVPAGLGEPPVFFRASSPHRTLFENLREL